MIADSPCKLYSGLGHGVGLKKGMALEFWVDGTWDTFDWISLWWIPIKRSFLVTLRFWEGQQWLYGGTVLE